MKLNGTIRGVDRLGVLVEHSEWGLRGHHLYRVSKDVPLNPPLAQQPPHEILVKGAAELLVTKERIYCLEAPPAHAFNGRLDYLPTGERPTPEPKVLASEVNHMLGEWDGAIYALRLRPGFDQTGLTPSQVRAVSAIDGYLEGWGATSYQWRFRYDLLRIRQDGTTDVIGEVPRTVDAYFEGYVYGTSFDGSSKELNVFRLSVSGGAPEVLYQRKKRPTGLGGGIDGLGRVAVDRDGVFLLDHGDGLVLRLPHAGGEPQVLKRGLAWAGGIRLVSDYLLIDLYMAESQLVLLKNGEKPTWHSSDDDPRFGTGRSGNTDIWVEALDGDFQYVLGRRAALPSVDLYTYDDRPAGFVYEYLPGGTINARRFPLREGHAFMGPLGIDEDCLYYTRNDGHNTWFYAMPKPAIR